MAGAARDRQPLADEEGSPQRNCTSHTPPRKPLLCLRNRPGGRSPFIAIWLSCRPPELWDRLPACLYPQTGWKPIPQLEDFADDPLAVNLRPLVQFLQRRKPIAGVLQLFLTLRIPLKTR